MATNTTPTEREEELWLQFATALCKNPQLVRGLKPECTAAWVRETATDLVNAWGELFADVERKPDPIRESGASPTDGAVQT